MVMNVLSLFDGMSCGRIALERAGIEVNNYYASELDKYAIKVTQANWPKTIQLGDVTKWREWDIDWSSIDLLIGGSPCQGFSFAGKQLAFDDPRSKLFFVYVDILNHIKSVNPNVKFMLENVKMKKEYLDVISERLGVEPVFINSALVSAQNRQRYYWANWGFGQPEDKGLVLRDIVEYSVDMKYKLSEKILKGFESKINRRAEKKSGFDKFNVRPLGEKVSCLTARYYKTAMSDPFVEVRSASMVGRKINPETGKRDDYNESLKAVQCLEVNEHGKSRCLSTVSKDTLVSDLPPGRHIDYDRKSYRKLTPIECERLQTVPDNYTEVIDRVGYSLYNYKEVNDEEVLYLCDVKLNGAKETPRQKSMVTYALCITSDLLGMDLLSFQSLKDTKNRNVNIAIQRLEKKEVAQEGCVIDITKTGLDMATLCTQIKSNLNLDQEGIKSAVTVRSYTGRLLKITLDGNYQEMRLFTMLIAIKLITQLKICTYVTDRASIHYCIDNLKESQGSLLSVDLSSLRMETTKQTVSNTQRYKMLGNGWTVDVIAHIFKSM